MHARSNLAHIPLEIDSVDLIIMGGLLRLSKKNFHAAPSGAPRDVTSSMTSRSIMVTWDSIECIERNGTITNYTVVFQEQGGANVLRTFSAGGLTPYTFQVAGANDTGTGPFTNVMTVITAEEG